MFLLAFFILLVFNLQAQQEFRHTVYFEQGEAIISLEQLEEIKLFSANAENLSQAKVVVRIYSNDAQSTDPNLSGRRAALMRQCLQREGIQATAIQTEQMGIALGEQASVHRAELILTTDEHLFQRKIYQEATFSELQKWFAPHYDYFDIYPKKDTILTTSKGVVLYIPNATFDTTSIDSTIQLWVNSSHKPMDILVHYMSTLSGKDFLNSSGLLHIQAFWKGQELQQPLRKNITILFPSHHYEPDALAYHSDPVFLSSTNWQTTQTEVLPCAGFYGNNGYFCDPQFLVQPRLPYFPASPSKPIFTNIDSIIAIHDARIQTFNNQLLELDKDIKNIPKEKKSSLLPKLEQKKKAIGWAQKSIELKKDDLREAYNREVEEKEAIYYQELAVYNKARSQQQQSYIRLLNNWANSKDSIQGLCEQEKEILQTAKNQLPTSFWTKAQQAMQQQEEPKTLGFWLTTQQLGWTNIAKKLPTVNTTNYQINTKESAYGISAFLVFKNSQTVIMGQAETGTSISFGQLPYEQKAHLIVIKSSEKGLSWGFYDINTNTIPPSVELDYYSRTEVLNKLIHLGS